MQKIDNVMNLLLNFLGVILVFLAGVSCRQLLKKPRNKVHFYVARDKDGELCLYLGKPVRGANEFYCSSDKISWLTRHLKNYGLKEEDYDYLKREDEPVEVFLNLED